MPNPKMIALETTFVSGDGKFYQNPPTYKQVKRTSKVALYERSRDGKPMDYEVFFIRVDRAGKVQKFPNGVIKTLEEDREKYPSSEQFGHIAWTLVNLDKALNRFEELCKQADDPVDKEEKSLIIPDTEFTIGELAEKNSTSYPTAFLFMKAALEAGSVKFIREERRNAKGKASKIYAKAA